VVCHWQESDTKLSTLIHKTLLALILAALCATPAPADTVSTAAALAKMEQADLARVGCNTRLDFIGWDGFVGRAKNMNHAIRCFSIYDQLASCAVMAVQAATFLDLERTGQSTFAATTNDLENKSGTSADDMDGLSLAESAPANMSPDQLGRYVYKQCSSYVVFH
jgi:hypothetical protein